MTLRDILIFIVLGLLIRGVSRWAGARAWLLYLTSILAVFWLQPLSPVRYLDFWLPAATLGLSALGWVATTPPEQRAWRANAPALAALAGVVLALGLTRFLSENGILTAARPPQFELVLAGVVLVALLAAGLGRLRLSPGALWVGIGLLILLLVVLKLPPLAAAASGFLRTLADQGAARAAATDLRWLGFSYLAFRILHTLRDRQNGRLLAVSFREYMTYLLFYPAFTAGPIDRIERFTKDLRQTVVFRDAPEIGLAGQRLALGLFKKFVVADGLALFALNAANAPQVQGAGWTWLLVYAYALQIYFDFSGYTDLAIGLGHLVGIALPENFNNPYFKPNLTQFWNNWHITLTMWFRAYWFNPLTRALRTAKKAAGGARYSPFAVLLVTQLSTMVLIGLWHGVAWNFVLWGAWHGVGLLAQNRFTDWMKPRYARLAGRPRLQSGVTLLTTLATFHYVALGWVFFALPDPALSLIVFGKLFGGNLMVSVEWNWKHWGIGLLALLILAVLAACAPARAQAETSGPQPQHSGDGPVKTAVASAVAATFTAQAALEGTTTPESMQSATATPTPAATATPSPTAGPPPTATPDMRPDPATWASWPVLPTVSARAVEIYRQGIAAGNDPHSFSTIGDCQSESNVFLGIYDTDRYFFAKGDEYLQATVDYYKGVFQRQSLSVRDGLSAPSALSPTWAYTGKCEANENPVQCELRVHKPAVMFINLGTNWRADASTDAYEKYLRQIVDLVIANGTLPILSTKADNVEGGNRINQVTARVAHDYDIPLWNFWALAQYLPDQGLDKTRQDVYLTVEAWDARSYSALELLDKLRQEFAKTP